MNNSSENSKKAGRTRSRKQRADATYSKLVHDKKQQFALKDQPLKQLLEEFKGGNDSIKQALASIKANTTSKNRQKALNRYDINKISKADKVPRSRAAVYYARDVPYVMKMANVDALTAKAMIALDDWEEISDVVLPALASGDTRVHDMYPRVATIMQASNRPNQYTPNSLTWATSNTEPINKVVRDELQLQQQTGKSDYMSALVDMTAPDAVNIEAVCTNLNPVLYRERIPTTNGTDTFVVYTTDTQSFTASSTGAINICINPLQVFTAASVTVTNGYFICNGSTTTYISGPATSFTTNFGMLKVTSCTVVIEIVAPDLTSSGYHEAAPLYDFANNTYNPSVTFSALQSGTYYQCHGAKRPMNVIMRPQMSFSAVPGSAVTSPFFTYGVYWAGSGLAALAPVRVTVHQTTEVTQSFINSFNILPFKIASPGYYTSQFIDQLYQVAPHISFLTEEHASGLCIALLSTKPHAQALMRAALTYLGGIKSCYMHTAKASNAISDSYSEVSFP